MGRDAHQGKAIKIVRVLSRVASRQEDKYADLATPREAPTRISTLFDDPIRADQQGWRQL